MLRRIIDTDGFNTIVKARYGYFVFNKNDCYIGRSIEKYGEISESENTVYKSICREGDVVVEVGSNIGVHTLPIAQAVGKTGRVYAFEPVRIVFQTLCANLAINSIENVECFQSGASNEEGVIRIPDLDNHKDFNFGGVCIDKFKSGIKVPIVKLDNFLELTKLKLLKIDVEGMEQQVIQGAANIINKFKPVLYVENDRVEQSRDLIELIASFDYKMYWHMPTLFMPDNYAGDKEQLFHIVSVNMFCVHKSADFNINVSKENEVTDSSFHPYAEDN